MYVNSVRNSNVYSFKSNENSEVKDVKAEQPTEKASEIQNKSVNEDKFDKKEPSQAEVSAPINNESKPQNSAEAIMAQINKMQKMQKILGGTILGIGILGALSFLSPKKWVRGLFTIPAGGVLGYFGANMLMVAKNIDKLKQMPQSDK